MKSTNVIIIAVLVGAASFFGGTKFRDYQLQKQRANLGGGQFLRQGTNVNGPNSQNRPGNGQGFGGGAVMGEIISKDDKSITVKMQDGSTKIVILSDSTSYNKSAEGSESDLQEGTKVAVIGTSNSDGSITAQNVQLDPQVRVFDAPEEKSPTNTQ